MGTLSGDRPPILQYRPLSLLLVVFVAVHVAGLLWGITHLSSYLHLAVPIEVYGDNELLAIDQLDFRDRIQVVVDEPVAEKLQSLTVKLGKRRFDYRGEEVRRWEVEREPREPIATGPPRVSAAGAAGGGARRRRISHVGMVVNWPGDWPFIRDYLPWVAVSGFFLLLAWWLCRRARTSPRLEARRAAAWGSKRFRKTHNRLGGSGPGSSPAWWSS